MDTVSTRTRSLTCTRQLSFCAGHRVMGHEGKCAHMHGHNYTVFVTAQAKPDSQSVDSLGRVVDFSVLKGRLDPFLQSEWDHGFILHKDDRAAISALVEFNAIARDQQPGLPASPTIIAPHRYNAHNGLLDTRFGRAHMEQKLFLLPYNPTAENLGRFLLEVVCPHLFADLPVEIVSVDVHETDNCSAQASN